MSKRGCCGFCGKRLPAPRFTTRDGELVELPTPHKCIDQRRRLAGVCQDCELPTEGMVGRALRCATHKLAKKKADTARHQREHRDDRNAAWRARYARRPRLAYMKRYSVHSADNPPSCADCRAPIEWSGRGRPSRRCDSCDPKAARSRDYKRRATERKLGA